jgi:hypothetical protein
MIKEKIVKQIEGLVGDLTYDYHANFIIEKKSIIDIAFDKYKINTVAELGCTWNIDCAYGLYIANKYHVDKVKFVDVVWGDSAVAACAGMDNSEIIAGNFGDEAICQQVGNVDAVIMFWILLHQVNPNWDKLLTMYSRNSEIMIIGNPQWRGEHTIRLFELGQDEYCKNVPIYRDVKKIFEAKKWSGSHEYWQWGITDNDLIDTMKKLGYKMAYYINCGKFDSLPNFDDCYYIFKKDN